MAARLRLTKDQPLNFEPSAVPLTWTRAAKTTRLSGQRSARGEGQSRTLWKDEGARIAKNVGDANSEYIESSLPRLVFKLDPVSSRDDQPVTESVIGESALRQDVGPMTDAAERLATAKQKRDANLKAAERAFQREAKCWALEHNILHRDLKVAESDLETAEAKALRANVSNETRLESARALAAHLSHQKEDLPKRIEAAKLESRKAEEEIKDQRDAISSDRGRVARKQEKTELQSSLANLDNRIHKAELAQVKADEKFTGRIPVEDTQVSSRSRLASQKASLFVSAANRREALKQRQQNKRVYDAAVKDGCEAAEDRQHVEACISRLEVALETTRLRLAAQMEEVRSQSSSAAPSGSRSVTPGYARTPSPQDLRSTGSTGSFTVSVDKDHLHTQPLDLSLKMVGLQNKSPMDANAKKTDDGSSSTSQLASKNTRMEHKSQQDELTEKDPEDSQGVSRKHSANDGELQRNFPTSSAATNSVQEKAEPIKKGGDFVGSNVEPVLTTAIRETPHELHEKAAIMSKHATPNIEGRRLSDHDLEKRVAESAQKNKDAKIKESSSGRRSSRTKEAGRRNSRTKEAGIGSHAVEKRRASQQIPAEQMDGVIQSMADTLSALSEWRRSFNQATGSDLMDSGAQQVKSWNKPVNYTRPAASTSKDQFAPGTTWSSGRDTHVRRCSSASDFKTVGQLSQSNWTSAPETNARKWVATVEEIERADSRNEFSFEDWSELDVATEMVRDFLSSMHSLSPSDRSAVSCSSSEMSSRLPSRGESRSGLKPRASPDLDCRSEASSFLSFAEEFFHMIASVSQSSVSLERSTSNLSSASIHLEKQRSRTSTPSRRLPEVSEIEPFDHASDNSLGAFAEEFTNMIASVSQSSASLERSTPDSDEQRHRASTPSRRLPEVSEAEPFDHASDISLGTYAEELTNMITSVPQSSASLERSTPDSDEQRSRTSTPSKSVPGRF